MKRNLLNIKNLLAILATGFCLVGFADTVKTQAMEKTEKPSEKEYRNLQHVQAGKKNMTAGDAGQCFSSVTLLISIIRNLRLSSIINFSVTRLRLPLPSTGKLRTEP